MALGRPQNSINQTNYRFEVILEDNKTLCRSLKEVAKLLDVGIATITRHFRNPDSKLRKYRTTNLMINRVNLPIYQERVLATY